MSTRHKLAFPGQSALLHAEFMVGDDDSKSLAAKIARARTLRSSSAKYAAELQAKGWLSAKTDASGSAQNVPPRARFLLDEFPPRDRSQPDGGTQGGDSTPSAPPSA